MWPMTVSSFFMEHFCGNGFLKRVRSMSGRLDWNGKTLVECVELDGDVITAWVQ